MLPQDQLWQLFNQAEKGTQAYYYYRNLLVESFKRLIKWLVWRHYPGTDRVDCLSHCTLVVIEAFDKLHGKELVRPLKTEIGYVCANATKMFRFENKLIPIPRTTLNRKGLPNPYFESPDYLTCHSQAEDRAIVNELLEFLKTNMNREIFKLMASGRTDVEIAKIIGCGRPQLEKYKERVIKLILEYRRC